MRNEGGGGCGRRDVGFTVFFDLKICAKTQRVVDEVCDDFPETKTAPPGKETNQKRPSSVFRWHTGQHWMPRETTGTQARAHCTDLDCRGRCHFHKTTHLNAPMWKTQCGKINRLQYSVLSVTRCDSFHTEDEIRHRHGQTDNLPCSFRNFIHSMVN